MPVKVGWQLTQKDLDWKALVAAPPQEKLRKAWASGISLFCCLFTPVCFSLST